MRPLACLLLAVWNGTFETDTLQNVSLPRIAGSGGHRQGYLATLASKGQDSGSNGSTAAVQSAFRKRVCSCCCCCRDCRQTPVPCHRVMLSCCRAHDVALRVFFQSVCAPNMLSLRSTVLICSHMGDFLLLGFFAGVFSAR